MIQNKVKYFGLQILVLIITGLVTIIELKGHPLLLKSKNNTKKFLQKISNVNNITN
jgi:hypothetical protein